jgi:hypothetical protein
MFKCTGLFTVEFPRKFNVMQHNILKAQIARQTLSTDRLLDINVTKSVHSMLQQIDPARNFKK